MKSYSILNILFLLLSCNEQQMRSQPTETITINGCEKLELIADSYNPYERKSWLPYSSNAKSAYPLDDSLNQICKNLNPNLVQLDSSCRKVFIYLCEKFYLSVYSDAKKNREDFSVYNAHVWNTDLFWLNYALNIITNKKMADGSSIDEYAKITSDWIFVEYIIAEAEKSKNAFSNKSFLKVHDSCIAIYPKVRDSLQLYKK